MKYLSADEMRAADKRCIEELGIPGAVLMNNAGSRVFDEVEQGPVGVVCGKGNNGGDGFVVARLTLVAGYEMRVVLLGKVEDVTGDARTYLDAYRRLGGPVLEAPDEKTASRAVAALADCATLVDAMLGTGVTGELRGAIRAAAEAWPKVRTVAVDLPTGLNTDTGETPGPGVRADVTVTFQFAKRAFQNPASQVYTGRVKVVDIGIPPVCADDAAWEQLRANFPGI